MQANLVHLMTQKRKNINRRMTQDIANNPKITVAPSSFSKYLKNFGSLNHFAVSKENKGS